jgi:T-complex protein 1 subunit zeta
MSLKSLNPNASVVRRANALLININAARGLQEVLRTNLGPKGTIKMLVGGAGDVKLTKDGNVLLKEMQIQSPTAALIARVATAQDEMTGDGTTSNCLLIAELLRASERYLDEGVHPSVLCEGFELAKQKTLQLLDEVKIKKQFVQSAEGDDDNDDDDGGEGGAEIIVEKETLLRVAEASLRTKLRRELADVLTPTVVKAVEIVRKPGKPIDLLMVEQMTMVCKTDTSTKLVNGLVLDHGTRHPDMAKRSENAFILTCNVSLEFEKSEVNSSFYYKSAEERQQCVEDERKFVDDRVRKLIEFKHSVIEANPGASFVVLNQKGIDIMSLDLLAKAGITALRRAKRRNMERLTLACGGIAVNTFDDLTPDVLGRADLVYEQTLGEDKYTFIEGVKNPLSCTVLIRGPHKHVIDQIKDAVRDGLRAVKNAIEDGAVVPGAGAFELYASVALRRWADTEVKGRPKLGVLAYADALLVIPKTLARNSGFDPTDTILHLSEELAAANGALVGLDLDTGDAIDPVAEGILDNYRVKRQLIHSTADISSQLLLIDEIIQAGQKK